MLFRSRLAALVLASAALLAASSSLAQPAPAQAPPAYLVMQSVHAASTDAMQTVTVQCPAGLRVSGAGFGAIVRNTAPAGAPAAASTVHEEGVAVVRSVPEARGRGWMVSAMSPGAQSTRQPWSLVVRAVCLRVG